VVCRQTTIALVEHDRWNLVASAECALQFGDLRRIRVCGKVTGLVVARDLADLAEIWSTDACDNQPHQDESGRDACPQPSRGPHSTSLLVVRTTPRYANSA